MIITDLLQNFLTVIGTVAMTGHLFGNIWVMQRDIKQLREEIKFLKERLDR